ncbi:ATP-binding cassette domain-containing protein [Natroniella sulfidigena]|uniref:ABC transporter ATP-binding protein n=1 Tax=Natroniella sulfidigena TaxID=723921 RepID=UPI00200A4F69|nr:ATP-binding cassette domain-containing protein [Natroniella sulfidigena]MCK8817464.1 ATP-binding cassette domain-containing protein [Natroniella sulfidigena]
MFTLKQVRYKDILQIESLKLPAKQVSCIVGPSGAGKSTLLKLLNNLNSADSGQVFYQGRDVEEIDPIQLRREVLMLSQKPVVYPETLQDNLEVGFELIEQSVPQLKQLSSILEIVKLDKELAAEVKNLSGGEKQRLSLARILLLDPEVLLLDEPSASLDQQTEQEVIENLVKYVKQEGKTLVMITHSKSIAQEYGDKVITIKNGKVAKEE